MEGGAENNGWQQPGASNDLLMFDTTIDLDLVAALENFIQPAASSQQPHQTAAMPSTSYAGTAHPFSASFPTPPGAYNNGFNTAHATTHPLGFAGCKVSGVQAVAVWMRRSSPVAPLPGPCAPSPPWIPSSQEGVRSGERDGSLATLMQRRRRHTVTPSPGGFQFPQLEQPVPPTL